MKYLGRERLHERSRPPRPRHQAQCLKVKLDLPIGTKRIPSRPAPPSRAGLHVGVNGEVVQTYSRYDVDSERALVSAYNASFYWKLSTSTISLVKASSWV